MEILKPIEFSAISEVKILQHVRLVNRHDLNPIYSKENLRAQFNLTGEIQGTITCFLILDEHDLTTSERNVIFPLFIESMNILIGRQMSTDKQLSHYQIKLSSPKFSMNSQEINSAIKLSLQKYDMELEELSFTVLVEYSLKAVN